MEYLGECNGRKVYWWDFSEENFNELPVNDWVAFAIEEGLPNDNMFDKFARASITRGILEFMVFGKLSSKLHDLFDEVVVTLNVMENQPDVFVMTTWHDKETLASAFWQCFFATALPDKTINENVKIICFHFDNVDKRLELADYINKFSEGWLP